MRFGKTVVVNNLLTPPRPVMELTLEEGMLTVAVADRAGCAIATVDYAGMRAALEALDA